MIEFLSCVCGVESWLIPSISPSDPEFDVLNPLHQGRFSHEAAATKADGREAGNARNLAEKQVAKMRFAAPKDQRTLSSSQHFRQGGRGRLSHPSWASDLGAGGKHILDTDRLSIEETIQHSKM
jgi:hypothetical protein